MIAASTFVSQAKDKRVGSLGLRGVGLLGAQGGYELSEGRVWELVEKLLKAGVLPKLEAEMKAGRQCCQQGAPSPQHLPPPTGCSQAGCLIVPGTSTPC